ncbi:MAG: DNA gyrase subunit A [Candidatus Ancaeobacter aquaticus]|nr:DNA gyrase subunit A [Candidatus Ancaeobacter aquaticus]
MYTRNEKIVPVLIEDEMKKSYIDYSMSVIVGRALPDARDGLKPVHRRVLFAMNEISNTHNKPHKKSARIVGEVLGKFHPHGDSAVYDTMVRLVQDFSLRYPLIDGQGNFGSIDGDSAAAMRYTEVRMAKIAEEILVDIEKDTVDFRPNFDETLSEPVVLPAKVPNLLINGSSGIAVGMATNIPPHNLDEIVDGLKLLIDDPEIPIKNITKVVKGPDFPTGGLICGVEEIKRMYETGRGLIKMRARAGIEPAKSGKESIIVTEIPYTVNKSNLITKIADLVNNKVIPGITDIRDESDKDGMRIVIELRRGELARVVLNQLYKHTQMQDTFGAIMLALDKGKPRVMNIKEMMICYIDHRKEVIFRRTKFELAKAEHRAHILEGFKIAIANIGEIVKIIRAAKDRNMARAKLLSKFKLSEIQANAILEMRLYQLTGLEIEKIEAEYLELIKRINYLKSILESEQKVLGLIKEDLDDLKKRYGDPRRTDIVPDEKELKIEDLIANEGCLITISHRGYIKRTSVSLYRQQRRGGKGVSGMETKEEDYVEHLFTASTHDYILFFTEDGMVHWQKVYEVPEGGRATKGKAIVNLLNIAADKKVAAMLCIREFDETRSIFMATKLGVVKKTKLSLYSNPRTGGIIAINIDKGDELIGVALTKQDDEIVLATREGQSIRFPTAQAKDQGRATRGVRGIKLNKKDEVESIEVVETDATLLVVTENGYGKRTNFDEYRTQSRAGKGIIAVKTTDKNGRVVGVNKVVDNDEIMMISANGKMVRVGVKAIRIIGRNTQGVRLINLDKGDRLVAVTRVIEEDEAKVAEAIEDENKEPTNV